MFFISGQSTTGGDFDTEGAKGHGLITYIICEFPDIKYHTINSHKV